MFCHARGGGTDESRLSNLALMPPRGCFRACNGYPLIGSIRIGIP